MPLVTRDLEISYGGFIIGGATNYLIDGPWTLERGYVRSAVECTVVVTASSSVELNGMTGALEAAFRTPRQDLVIKIGPAVAVSLRHSDSTGFDSDPVIVKVGDPDADSSRTRKYRIRIEFGMPADNVPDAGRRFHSINVEFGPQRRRRVTFTGTFTAIGTTGARQMYQANFEAFANSVLSAFGGTWEMVQEPVTTENSTNKTLEFQVVFQEIIYPQAGPIDDPAIIDQQFTLTRQRTAPGDAPAASLAGSIASNARVKRLINIQAQYSAWIKKDAGIGASLNTKWEGQIRPWIIEQARTIFGAQTAVVTDESVSLQFDSNHISATMTIMLVPQAEVIEARTTVRDTRDPGLRIVPVWNGRTTDRFIYQGPEIMRREITTTLRVLGNVRIEDVSPFDTRRKDAIFDRWVLIAHNVTASPIVIGGCGISDEITMTDWTEEIVLEIANRVSAQVPFFGTVAIRR